MVYQKNIPLNKIQTRQSPFFNNKPIRWILNMNFA
jgi:hypothetical protein